jgi:hypothetical protein
MSMLTTIDTHERSAVDLRPIADHIFMKAVLERESR